MFSGLFTIVNLFCYSLLLAVIIRGKISKFDSHTHAQKERVGRSLVPYSFRVADFRFGLVAVAFYIRPDQFNFPFTLE